MRLAQLLDLGDDFLIPRRPYGEAEYHTGELDQIGGPVCGWGGLDYEGPGWFRVGGGGVGGGWGWEGVREELAVKAFPVC